ncbi:alanine--tRNA ligase [Candidatus Uhrbacteria bacterium]|nr:alanine--tRNA ligase [Candidatus Uhrbacteria bacterium]
MNSSEIRKNFLDYFNKRGHAVVPSSSLIPDDPSVLLTTAGMQQFKKYYTGEADALKDFCSKSTASIQKSFRTSDIDEVGDESHLTFFEMLGNFSFGGYFKREAITYAHEFITKVMQLPISYVTVFEGSATVPKDEESRAIWQELGIVDIREEGMDDVFWGPTGTSGPCGPTAEIYCKNASGKDIEVWNIVFNQFMCSGSREELLSGNATLSPLDIFGIDTGMGLERLAMISQSTKTIFETDLFSPLMDLLPQSMDVRTKRIIADHARGTAFLLSEGVQPSNKERGYVLRRLLRRIIVHEYLAHETPFPLENILSAAVREYRGFYPELNEQTVLKEFATEKEKFLKTLKNGLKELQKLENLTPQNAFKLYESYGLPFEIIKEIGGDRAASLSRASFDEEFKKHQEISRAGLEKKFGGHGLLLDTGELKAKDEQELKIVTRLHTATHLLQQALRTVLGEAVSQKGSDITVERTRFDFSFDRKLMPEEIQEVEQVINDIIQKDLPVQKVELPIDEAKKTGALYFFSAKGGSASGGKEKYPDHVNIYFVGNSLEEAFSKEFCGGPHVTRTGEIGKVKIAKEEAVAAGIRRIRAVVE